MQKNGKAEELEEVEVSPEEAAAKVREAVIRQGCIDGPPTQIIGYRSCSEGVQYALRSCRFAGTDQYLVACQQGSHTYHWYRDSTTIPDYEDRSRSFKGSASCLRH